MSTYYVHCALAHSRCSYCGLKEVQSVILRHTAEFAALSQQGEHVCALKEANSEPVLYKDGFTSEGERDPWNWDEGRDERKTVLSDYEATIYFSTW